MAISTSYTLGIIPDLNFTLYNLLQRGQVDNATRARLQYARLTAVSDLYTIALNYLEYLTQLPLGTDFVWVAQGRSMFCLTLPLCFAEKPLSPSQQEGMRRLQSAIGVADSLGWWLSYELPCPRNLKRSLDPELISSRSLRDDYVDTLVERFPPDADYPHRTTESMAIADLTERVAKYTTQIAALPAGDSKIPRLAGRLANCQQALALITTVQEMNALPGKLGQIQLEA
jgi:hypothetical protein